MTARSASALRKSIPQRKPNGAKAAAKPKSARLPEWNLADLYSGIGAPEVTRDLEKMDAECLAFEADYKGKLAEQAAGDRSDAEGVIRGRADGAHDGPKEMPARSR